MMRYINYASYVLRHKWHVFWAGCRIGVPLVALMHDNSKFLTEIDNFVAGVEGAGRKPNTEITNAIRARLNSQLKASAA